MENNFRLVRIAADAVDVYWKGEKTGEFIMDLDGSYMYFPFSLEEKICSRGGFTVGFLRQLSDELERINKPWNDGIHDYFEKKKFIAEQFDLPLS
jgi:hypothetical protein